MRPRLSIQECKGISLFHRKGSGTCDTTLTPFRCCGYWSRIVCGYGRVRCHGIIIIAP